MHNKIKAKALELGFDACGIAPAHYLAEEAQGLQKWLNNGYHASMKWMENHFEKRVDPTLLVEEAQSVIVVLLNYYPHEVQQKDAPQIAKYAYGTDYHYVVKEKLTALFDYINGEIAPITGRMFVDSAPVLERAWAVEAGLGWIGKNSLLLNKRLGSFFVIGELIIDLPLIYDTPLSQSFCGNCTKCIDSCPTGAIREAKVVDSSRCLSYWTIEHKGEIDPTLKDTMENRAFGCDICQDVCPWNRKPKPHTTEAFLPNPEMLTYTQEEWETISANSFNEFFRKSAVKRTKYSGLQRNISSLSDNAEKE